MDKSKNKVIKYIPHGLNNKKFHPLEETDKEFIEFKQKLFDNQKSKNFKLFFNSRNIRRKMHI